MRKILLSGGVEAFADCTKIEADRLAREAGAIICKCFPGNPTRSATDGFFHYFLEDGLEVGHYHAIMRTWHPILREWCPKLYGNLVTVHAHLDDSI